MSTKTKKNRGIKIVRKSNDLIEARYRFDVWEMRLFSTVLSELRQEDEDFHTYRIYLKDIINDFSINNGNAYELLRSAASSLMDKKFYVDYESDGAIREQKYHIIRKVDTMKEMLDENKRSQHEYIEIAIEPEMKPLLLELKSRFTTYELSNIVKFKSNYTLRIYEHLKQYERIGWRDLDVDYLRRVFELEEEYPLFANFYQKVIEPAERDINLYTDIHITAIEKLKEGRKVSSLRFRFRGKSKEDIKKAHRGEKPLPAGMLAAENAQTPTERAGDAMLVTEKDVLFNELHAVVVGDFGVTPTVLLQLLDNHNREQIDQALRVTRRARANGNINNIAGFFVEALKKGFTDVKEESNKKVAKEQAKKEMKEALHNEIATLKDEEGQKINDRIRVLVAEKPNTTVLAVAQIREKNKAIVELVEKDVKRDLTLEDFRQNPVLRQLVKSTIVEMNEAAFSDILVFYEPKIRGLEIQLKSYER